MKKGWRKIVVESPFERFVSDLVNEEGIFRRKLVFFVAKEFGLTEEGARLKLIKFFENHKDEYKISKKASPVGKQEFLFVQKKSK
jgi:hypothetical protein